MRKMTEQEIQETVARSNWATICTVTPDGKPYAIEATYFIDGEHLGFMINPRGQTMRNLATHAELLLKITLTNADLSVWTGVSLFGTGEQVVDKDHIRQGWAALGAVMNADYSEVAQKFTQSDRPSPYLRCRITHRTGRCSA